VLICVLFYSTNTFWVVDLRWNSKKPIRKCFWLLNQSSVVRSFKYTIHCTPWLIYFLITNIGVWYFITITLNSGCWPWVLCHKRYLRERWQIPRMDIKTPPWKPSSQISFPTTRIRRHRICPTFPPPRWITAVAISSSAVSPMMTDPWSPGPYLRLVEVWTRIRWRLHEDALRSIMSLWCSSNLNIISASNIMAKIIPQLPDNSSMCTCRLELISHLELISY